MPVRISNLNTFIAGREEWAYTAIVAFWPASTCTSNAFKTLSLFVIFRGFSCGRNINEYIRAGVVKVLLFRFRVNAVFPSCNLSRTIVQKRGQCGFQSDGLSKESI